MQLVKIGTGIKMKTDKELVIHIENIHTYIQIKYNRKIQYT